jgi:hypothetical protein
VRQTPLRESHPVKGKDQSDMVRINKELDASSNIPDLRRLTGLRLASLGSHAWRGCRLITCLHGIHQATGVQVSPKLLAMAKCAGRSNPVLSPDATSGRHNRKACCWSGGEKIPEEANASRKLEDMVWNMTNRKTCKHPLQGERADIRAVSHCEKVWRTF